MSNSLIPTPVVNKNGVHTTVYKVAGGTVSSTAGTLPAPAVTSSDNARYTPLFLDIMDCLSVTMSDPFSGIPGDLTEELVQRRLAGYPEDTQRYIMDVQQHHPEDTYFDRMLISMVSRRESPEMIENALYVYDNLPDQWDAIVFSDEWNEDNVFATDIDLTRKINGATEYSVRGYKFGTEEYSLRHYNERTRKQVLAVIALCLDLEMDGRFNDGGIQSNDTSMYLADESTARVLISEPERLAEVLVKLQKHRRTDWDVIEAIENAPSVPLREGTL